MKSYSAEGIVIKRQNFGEADKLITILSKERGKITLKAKGLRKINSRRSGSLELFNQVKITAATGRSSLDILTEVNVLDSFTSWRKQLGRVNVAYQLCEVVDKLLPEQQPYPQVYVVLSQSLSQISNLGEDWQIKLNAWFKDILTDLGYWPEDRPFTGDINKFIESIIQRPLNSHKILKKLS